LQLSQLDLRTNYEVRDPADNWQAVFHSLSCILFQVLIFHLSHTSFAGIPALSSLHSPYEDWHELLQAGHVCWDDHDVINGQPTGAVRVSFGYMSTFEDCLAVIRFIRKYFVESGGERTVKRIDKTLNARISKGLSNLETSTASSGLMMDNSINGGIVDSDTHATTSIQLESIIVYPIKSCAGFSVRVWPLSDCGKLTKPKAILFYQTCLLPFPMAFTFH
jgi:hypothetical protein